MCNSVKKQSQPPTTRRGAVAAAAAGFLASLVGVSVAGAEIPQALPSCPTEGNCVSSSSFKLVRELSTAVPVPHLELVHFRFWSLFLLFVASCLEISIVHGGRARRLACLTYDCFVWTA